jgi:threonine synthase
MSTVLTSVTTMTCAGCGAVAPPDEPRPFRCRNAGQGDVDHVMRRSIDIDTPGLREAFYDHEADPFIRYRKLTHAWHTAMAAGMSDSGFIALVERLEQRIAVIDGGGFHVTPFYQHYALTRALDLHADLWVKNETGNVGQSHKGRHMMGLAIWLAVAERLDASIAKQRLAIASCGNAALAAAIVARAAERPLDVFIPIDANEAVVARLVQLGANVTRCPRREGEQGDPAYLRFREAVAQGALPFTAQGNENGLAIEGCQTLGWEIVSQLIANRATLDRLFVQVGGGALASALIAAFEEAHKAGLVREMPRIHAVQTSASPLARAWDRLQSSTIDYAVRHRSEFMWPWETAPHSVAHGIIDDETYDWAAVARGMLASGGAPVVVSEERLKEANAIAVETTGIPADFTGTAGLAGAIELQHRGEIAHDESIGVLFTGRQRKAFAG